MMDIKTYIIALLVIALIRWLIPKFGKLVNWLIIKLVKLTEKTIKGSKLGEKRKKKVLLFLKIFGIKATNEISNLIDLAVDALNSKKDNTIDNINGEAMNTLDKTISKISKNE